MNEQTTEKHVAKGYPLAQNRQLPGNKVVQLAKMLTPLDLPVEIRAHDHWPRVPKHGHLKPIVVDLAIGLLHASPQVILVFYLRAVFKRTSGFPDVSITYGQVHSAVVTVRAAGLHGEGMFFVLGEDDRYPEGQTIDGRDVCKRRVEPFGGKRGAHHFTIVEIFTARPSRGNYRESVG